LRDAGRFVDAGRRIGVSPLGASAGGGTSLPIDPAVAADELGMAAVFENSMDAVASRDGVAEFAFCVARTLVDLSRLAGDMVLWASTEFGWVVFADRHTTGSSALPHKKNPDAAELTRGKAASSVGRLTALLAMEKGLPLTYNRDLQEDKEHLFAMSDDLSGALAALSPMLESASFDPPAPDGSVVAMDLAEILVTRGVPFRTAHETVGALVRHLADDGRDLGRASGEDLVAAHPAFTAEDAAMLDPSASVSARRSPGGGSFASVATQLEQISAELDRL
jgi:argininosuccinate lyase